MSDHVRPIQEKDIAEVAKLWTPAAEEDVLRWIWSDPDNPQKLNAFVAEDSTGQINGVIAYTSAVYTSGTTSFTGVFPFSWKIKSGHKGFAGIALMKKVLADRSVAMAIGGTDFSAKLLPLFQFRKVLIRHKYYRIFNPIQFYSTLKIPWKRRIIKTLVLLPSMFIPQKAQMAHSRITLEPCGDRDPGQYQGLSKSVIEKKITAQYLSWLKRSPNAVCHPFFVCEEGKPVGLFVGLVHNIKKGTYGSIAHLSYLGEKQHRWKDALCLITAFFRAQGCCAMSAVASNVHATRAFSKSMQRFIVSEPVLVRDSANTLADHAPEQWHIQFSEGDTVLLQ